MNKVLVIAEAGVNHNGSLDLAKQLIDAAVDAGADIVKFQTFKAEKLVSKSAEKAEYQKMTTDEDESQFSMLKKLELDDRMHEELINYCNERGIQFLSTPFDIDSAHYLIDMGIDIIKIPSGEITNYPFLKQLGQLGKSVILSTGMSKLSEIEDALTVLKNEGVKDITVLHCNTEYPTPIEDVNLLAMNTIGSAFGVDIGYSDHTLGIEIPIAAVALGATVIEKHFTLDKSSEGPDHKASLEPHELKSMVTAIRHIEKAMGNGVKWPSKSEFKNRPIGRKA